MSKPNTKHIIGFDVRQYAKKAPVVVPWVCPDDYVDVDYVKCGYSE
jgi:hypothetical protein